MFQYTREMCLEIAQTCKLSIEFRRKNASAWNKARNKGWFKDYTWFTDGRHLGLNGKWTVESCTEKARQFSRKVDFQRKASGAYKYAVVHGLLEKFDWFNDCSIDLEYGKVYCVYCYTFQLGKRRYIYIGLTLRPHIRDRRHREGDSSVFDFAEKHVLPIPRMQVLKKDLTQSEARYEEDRYRRVYEAAGYQIINRAKTGVMIGSVGGMHRKWTKPKCREEAMKFSSRGEFQKKSPSAYQAALLKWWLDEYDWFELKHHRRWTEEEFLAEARKYKSIKEFQRGNNAAYIVGGTRGWMSKCTWFQPGQGWSVRVLRARRNAREVIQMTLSGVPIAKYDTAIEAIWKSGVTSLRKCLNGERRQAGGYRWQYADQIPESSLPVKSDILIGERNCRGMSGVGLQ